MGDRSKIEWTDATWNPIRARNRVTGKLGWHCVHASRGCAGCYAETMNLWRGTGLPYKPGHEADIEIVVDEQALLKPLRWGRPRMIFPGSMTDLFASFVTDAMLDQVFAVMAACACHPLRGHVFQVLTKRPDRMRAYLADPALPKRLARAWCHVGRHTNKGWTTLAWRPDGEDSVPAHWPLPNVLVGTSVEDQQSANARREPLANLAADGWKTFVSFEPALGFVDWAGWCFVYWLISGGESGRHARPTHPDWHRAARDYCELVGIPYFFKQWGEFGPGDDVIHDAVVGSHGHPGRQMAFMRHLGKRDAGRLLDGVEHNGLPNLTEVARAA